MAARNWPLKLDTLLTCPICLCECKDPRVLTCLHSLCRECLNRHIDTSAEGNQFCCPSCRHECEVPAGGASVVPKNFFFNSLKEILQEAERETQDVPFSAQVGLPTPRIKEQDCSNISMDETHHGTATVFCVNCAQMYCSECESSHRRFEMFKNHRLEPVETVDRVTIKADSPSDKTPSCDQHSNLLTDMYCDTCRVPVCMKCSLLKHKNHDYREIEEAADESKTLLSTLVDTAESISSRLDRNMQELENSEWNINAECEETCSQVQDTAEEIRQLVTKREKSVIQEIHQAQTTALTQLNAAYKEAEINKAAVESLLSYMKALLVSENVTNQVVHTPGLQKQIQRHDLAPLQSVTLEVDLERKTRSFSALTAILGAVSVHQTTVTHGLKGAKGAVTEEMKVPLDAPLLELKPNVGGTTVSGIAMIRDCVCAIEHWQPYLWVHNIKTSKHKVHKLDGLRPAGMTLVQGDTLVIMDYNNRLHMIGIDQQMDITEHSTKDIPFEPGDVSVDPASGKLIICNLTDNQIVICDTHGNIERRITVKTDIEYPGLRCALANRDGFIVLDYSKTGKLHWVDADGNVTHTYDESLHWPYDIVQSSRGHVILADLYHHSLHFIGDNKKLSHFLLTETDDFRHPRCAFLDEANARLLVGCGDKAGARKVSIYQWPFGDYTSHTSHKLHVELGHQ